MGLGHAHGAHLEKPHAYAAAGELPRSLAAREPRADYIDDWRTH